MSEIRFSSDLNAPWEAVWEHVLYLESINREMLPFFKMTGPDDNLMQLAQSKAFGEPLSESKVLLGGWLPAERMQVTLSAGGQDEQSGWFVEQSGMRLMKQWRHERRLERLAHGCRLSDKLAFSLRIPGATPLLAPVLRAFFAHRHRWLRREFGILVDPRPLSLPDGL